MARGKQNRANGAAQLDNLKRDLDALQRNVRALTERMASTTSEHVANAANDAVGDVEDWASGGVDSVRDLIRSQPLAAIAISMSAGAALSLLIRRG